MSSPFVLWCVYDHPRDFPKHWVVRGWDALRNMPDPGATLHSTLAEARDWITTVAPGAVHIPRCQTDDPVIKEVWL